MRKSALWSLTLHLLAAGALLALPKNDHSITVNRSEVFVEVVAPGSVHQHQKSARKPKLPPSSSTETPVPVVAPATTEQAVAPSASEPTTPTTTTVPTPAADGAGGEDTGTAMAMYIAQVFKKIESAKQYPKDAILREESGQVIVCVTIRPDGTTEDPHIEVPSPFESLNQAAQKTLSEMGQFPPLPAAFKDPVRIKIPIRYEIHHH